MAIGVQLTGYPPLPLLPRGLRVRTSSRKPAPPLVTRHPAMHGSGCCQAQGCAVYCPARLD
eukprot:3323414-Pleurochrysis_carterae.AAC.1